MVTASHNPANYNGIKMVLKEARPANRENALDAIEEAVLSSRPLPTVATFDERGRLAPELPRRPYIERLLSQVEDCDLKPLKILCHAGNGCAGPVIDALETHLPFTFVKLDHRPDPALPERHSEPAAAGKALAGGRGGRRQRRRSRHRLGRRLRPLLLLRPQGTLRRRLLPRRADRPDGAAAGSRARRSSTIRG